MLHTYRPAVAHASSSSPSSRTPRTPSSPAGKGSGSSTPKAAPQPIGRARATTIPNNRAPSPTNDQHSRDGAAIAPSTSLPSDSSFSLLPPKPSPSHPRSADDSTHLNGTGHGESFDINTPAGVPSPVISQPSSPSVPPPPYSTASSVPPLSSPTSSSQSARIRSSAASALQVLTRPNGSAVVLPSSTADLPRASTATMNGNTIQRAGQPPSPKSSQSDSLAVHRDVVSGDGHAMSQSQPVSPRMRGRSLLLSTLLPGLFPSTSPSALAPPTGSPQRVFSSPPRRPLPTASGTASPSITAAALPSPATTAAPPQLASSTPSTAATSALTPEKLHLPGMSHLLQLQNQRKEEDNERRRRDEEEADRQRLIHQQLQQQPLNLHDLEPRLLQLQQERLAAEPVEEGKDSAAAKRAGIIQDTTRSLSRGPPQEQLQSDAQEAEPAVSLPLLLSGALLLGVTAWAGWTWYARQQRRLRK